MIRDAQYDELQLPSPNLLVKYLAMCQNRLIEVLDSHEFKLRKLSMPHRAMFYDLKSKDPMRQFFKHQSRIWREGKPVWGYIFSLPKRFLEDEKINGIGLLLHGMNPKHPIHPDALSYWAYRLYQETENPDPDEDLLPLIQKIKSGEDRLFGYPVPEYFTNEVKLGLTHICIDTKKLLNRPLQSHPFPALLLNDPSHFATLMPHWTWPLDLYNHWESLV